MKPKNIRRVFLLAVVMSSLIFPIQIFAISQTNTSATTIVGQSVFGYVPGVANGGLPNNGDITRGFYNPTAISSNGTKMAVVDYTNHRVLIYNTIPTTDNPTPDVVVGQPDLYLGISTARILASPTAATLKYPTGVLLTSSKLLIVDSGNNRVLIYNTIPTINGVSADVVIGQTDMITGTVNTGGRSASSLSSPEAIYSDDGIRLFITDKSNSRILIFNSIPIANGASANLVVGQSDFITGSPGCSAIKFSNPSAVYVLGTKLFIADYTYNRVLIWNTIPIANGASADVVIGQTNTTNATSGTLVNKLKSPRGIFSDGTKLFIADYGNHRVLIYNTVPVAHNASANNVIGQADFTHGSANQGGTTASANTLYNPYQLYSNGTKLYVADYNNNRILVYNTVPATDNVSADIVFGQPNMTTNKKDQTWNITTSTVNGPIHSYVYGSKLLVADAGNNRVLIYNTIPTSNGASADVVIGQADFNSNLANRGGAISANTLSVPYHLFISSGKLFVVDNGNNRVLIYNTIPTSNGASADVVIGQADMITGTANTGSRSATTLSGPVSVYSDNGTRLFIADRANNRVLIYNTIPIVNGASANLVLGQADFISGSANRAGTVAANTFFLPNDIDMVGDKLIVADFFNYRVLIYNTIPITSGVSADIVIGQPNMTTRTACNTTTNNITASCFSGPIGAYSDDTRIFVSDYYNNRVLVYNTIPTSNGASADVVLGQSSFTSGSYNQGGYPSASTLFLPVHISTDSTKLYIGQNGVYKEEYGGRVSIFTLGPASSSASTVDKTLSRDITVNLSASSDAKEFMISEDSGFTGASWQTYSTSVPITLSESAGEKNVYVKFRDYANYESDVITLNTTYIILPTLTTSSPTSIERTTATLNGEILTTGGENPTSRGFNYGLTTDYGTNTDDETSSYSTGTYSLNISSLSCSTTYHYRSYATNSAGTATSTPDATFTTSICPSRSGGYLPGYGPKVIIPVIPITPIEGCAPGNLFNTTTGNSCTVPPTIISGCDNRNTGFSITTGNSCVGNPGTPNPSLSSGHIYNLGTTTLRNGSTGEVVKELQRFLNLKLNLGLVVDGIFGPKTKAAVIQFQKANNLVPDGIVGPLTKAKMQ